MLGHSAGIHTGSRLYIKNTTPEKSSQAQRSHIPTPHTSPHLHAKKRVYRDGQGTRGTNNHGYKKHCRHLDNHGHHNDGPMSLPLLPSPMPPLPKAPPYLQEHSNGSHSDITPTTMQNILDTYLGNANCASQQYFQRLTLSLQPSKNSPNFPRRGVTKQILKDMRQGILDEIHASMILNSLEVPPQEIINIKNLFDSLKTKFNIKATQKFHHFLNLNIENICESLYIVENMGEFIEKLQNEIHAALQGMHKNRKSNLDVALVLKSALSDAHVYIRDHVTLHKLFERLCMIRMNTFDSYSSQEHRTDPRTQAIQDTKKLFNICSVPQHALEKLETFQENNGNLIAPLDLDAICLKLHTDWHLSEECIPYILYDTVVYSKEKKFAAIDTESHLMDGPIVDITTSVTDAPDITREQPLDDLTEIKSEPEEIPFPLLFHPKQKKDEAARKSHRSVCVPELYPQNLP